MGNIKYGEDGWTIEETCFDPSCLGKTESIFCQGSGYLGIRNALEERYAEETRGMFVAGSFDRADAFSVPELPNFPDVTGIDIWLDGERMALTGQNHEAYVRKMNYRTGETTREFIYHTQSGKRVKLSFRRFVSLSREHIAAGGVSVEPLDADVALRLESGIDARTTNTGVQHFIRFDGRIHEQRYLQSAVVTRESGILAAVSCVHRLELNGVPAVQPPQGGEPSRPADWLTTVPYIRNRRNLQIFTLEVKAGGTLRLEKLSSVRTSRDPEYLDREGDPAEAARADGLRELKELEAAGYEALLDESVKCWEVFWKENDVCIESNNIFDQIAVRFSIYHLHIMNKPDDSRLGVGAKGLSGEEYCGHSFWDTEIFLMPFYLFTNPGAARSLLEYRYHILAGARRKARDAGYRGAMYPWEAAWITDGETCLDIIGVDVETGKPMRVLCGEIEVHISADVAYAVWQYYTATKDTEFMERFGCEMILDTARFWASRAEWVAERGRYELKNVIGPDEYKEEVDNDVYTNYMAAYNMRLALRILDKLPKAVRERLNKALDLSGLRRELETVLPALYLPEPDGNGIIPQNDTYLSLKELDLSRYKASGRAGSIHEDYSIARLKEYQVSKQGDLTVLFFLQDSLFDARTKRENYLYYEAHTLHDSSLSKCTHSILACDLGMEEAYPFFEGAAAVDAGPNMHSCDNGIHSASCGGIWQCAVMGFGGVRIRDDSLSILPRLPREWKRLTYNIRWQSSILTVEASPEETTVTNAGLVPVTLRLPGGPVTLQAARSITCPRP